MQNRNITPKTNQVLNTGNDTKSKDLNCDYRYIMTLGNLN